MTSSHPSSHPLSSHTSIQRKARYELLLIILMMSAVYVFSSIYDLFEVIVTYVHQHEAWDIDEGLIVTFYLSIALAIFALRRWREQRITEKLLQQRLVDLERALSEVRQLQGIIPICASCKNVRDDQGYWHQVETYLRSHSNADFSHGLCPSCVSKLYPGYAASKSDSSVSTRRIAGAR